LCIAGATSPVISHVLDTALGRPAAGVLITLQRAAPGGGGCAWDTVAEARTDGDGRVPALLPRGNYVAPGQLLNYELTSQDTRMAQQCGRAWA